MVDERQVARLNKALEPGAPVANEWLEMLDELGILTEIDPEFDSGHGLEDAVRWVRKMRKGAQAEEARRRAGSSAPGRFLRSVQVRNAELKGRSAAFQLALSHWVADDADGDEDVAAFRKRHLPGGDVMPLDSIQQWIQQKVDEQSRNVYLVSLAVPTGWSRGDPVPAAGSSAVLGTQSVTALRAIIAASARTRNTDNLRMVLDDRTAPPPARQECAWWLSLPPGVLAAISAQ